MRQEDFHGSRPAMISTYKGQSFTWLAFSVSAARWLLPPVTILPSEIGSGARPKRMGFGFTRSEVAMAQAGGDRRKTSSWYDATPAARWYRTARWLRLSEAVKTRDLCTCQLCGIKITGKGQAIADHRVPHKGDLALFWDADNIWCLCKACHDGPKQRAEKSGRPVRFVSLDGRVTTLGG